jgi:hypothetical protein
VGEDQGEKGEEVFELVDIRCCTRSIRGSCHKDMESQKQAGNQRKKYRDVVKKREVRDRKGGKNAS